MRKYHTQLDDANYHAIDLQKTLAIKDRFFFIFEDAEVTWVTVVAGLGPKAVTKRFSLTPPVVRLFPHTELPRLTHDAGRRSLRNVRYIRKLPRSERLLRDPGISHPGTQNHK